MSDKGLHSEYIKNAYNSIKKNPSVKGQKISTDISPKITYEWQIRT